MRNLSRLPYSPLLNNSRGNTILGVLCLIAVSVAAFQISLSDSMSVNAGIKNARILNARDALEARIKSYSSLGSTFRSSMHPSLPLSLNAELRNCIFGIGPNPCKGKTKTPVALYYPMSTTEIASSLDIKRISGPGKENLLPTESAFYDNKGNLCVPNAKGVIEESCKFFEVITTFIAKCPDNTETCIVAESIAVNYIIRAATSLSGSSSQTLGGFQLATIDLSAPDVSVTSILPATPGSSSSNVTISLLPSTSTLSLETITASLKSLGMNDSKIEKFAQEFQESGINDLSKLPFLVKVDQPDAKWMKLVVDSGITYVDAAYALYWSHNPWTPELLASTVAAIADVKNPQIAYAIADSLVTDKAVANQMAAAVSSISNISVAAGIITGGHTGDPVKMEKIVSAVSQISNPIIAGNLAEIGVTDPTIASQIASIVSVLPDPYSAHWIIKSGGGDVAKTQEILTKALNSTEEPGDSGSSNTTTTAAAPTPTPPPPPVEISLMPTCSTCAPVTY